MLDRIVMNLGVLGAGFLIGVSLISCTSPTGATSPDFISPDGEILIPVYVSAISTQSAPFFFTEGVRIWIPLEDATLYGIEPVEVYFQIPEAPDLELLEEEELEDDLEAPRLTV